MKHVQVFSSNRLAAPTLEIFMELRGTWKKDSEGYMEFETSQLQRLYERVTQEYHQIFNRYLDRFDDEEIASAEAMAAGYEMITDYKEIDGVREFATTYKTPSHLVDLWYTTKGAGNKKDYNRGFIRISSRKP